MLGEIPPADEDLDENERSVSSNGVIVITPSFFGYESAIRDAFYEAGWHCELIDERPINWPVMKALHRLLPTIMSRITERHVRAKAIEIPESTVKLILVIKGETVSERTMKALKLKFPSATVAYYSYDKLTSTDNYLRIRQFFDYAFSFDRSDVESHSTLAYKPLFYAPSFSLEASGGSTAARGYDISFVGTLNPTRYQVVTRVAECFPRTRIVLYYPARWIFWLKRLTSAPYRRIPTRQICFDKINTAEVATIFKQSRVVVDLQKPGQTGLTMRTFECLASGAALLTSNRSIVKEKFYSPHKVGIFSIGSIDQAITEASRLMSEKNAGLPLNEFYKHSVSYWVQDFINLTDRPGDGESQRQIAEQVKQ